MKILYLHQYFTTPSMSGGTRSYEMARRLVEMGHEVHIVTTWRNASEKRDWWVEDIDGVHVHWLPVPYSNAMGFVQRMKAFLHFAARSAKRAAAIGGDLVFATSTPLTIALPAVAAARKLKRPMVFEVRDLWPLLPIAIGALRAPWTIALARWLERFAYRNADRIVALSPGMAEGVIETGYDPARVHVIPNSCDLDLFRPDAAAGAAFRRQHPELGDGPIILYAGTLGQINGVAYLADIASHLQNHHAGARCVVIGGGAEEQKVRERAMELGVLGKNFFHYPPMSKTDLVGAFQAASISLSLFIDLPEMQHNSANKFFDSLASGRPVAINYGGWQAELIEQYRCGICLDYDTGASAEKLAVLLRDESEMKEMGHNSRRLAEEQFDRDKLAADLRDVLEMSYRSAAP
jgi:glycosyltransferase involved in cell wall biosynthesis